MSKAAKNARASRPALILPALAFLFEVWVWDRLVAVVRWFLDQIPWAELRRRGRAQFNQWPATVSVLTFGVPFVVVEGGCTVSVVLIALGHVLLGTLLYIVLKIALLTMVALIFDLTKEKLLTLPWFVFLYERLGVLHDYAHRIVAPYRESARRFLRRFRRQAHAWLLRFAAQWRIGRGSLLSGIDSDWGRLANPRRARHRSGPFDAGS